VQDQRNGWFNHEGGLLAFSLEKETAVKDLKSLKDAGLLKFSGPNKTGKYKLTEMAVPYLNKIGK
jgi:hypothetical protein